MIYLTSNNTSGGNHGHQLKDLLGGYAIARTFDFEYVHTYYPYLEFFAVGYNEKRVDVLDESIIYIRQGRTFWNGISYAEATQIFGSVAQKYPGHDVLISVESALRLHPCQTVGWYNQGLLAKNVFEQIHEELSSKYRRKHGRRPHRFDQNVINVAVHINRGESYNRVKYPDHFASDWNVRYMFDLSYFETIFNQLRSILSNRKYLIHIYTEQQNSEEIVARFSKDQDVVMHVGANRNQIADEVVKDIFHHFISSDILVVCNSSFSAMASYFRKGKPTIYHPHIHLFDLPETDFYATDNTGEFDAARLKTIVENFNRQVTCP